MYMCSNSFVLHIVFPNIIICYSKNMPTMAMEYILQYLEGTAQGLLIVFVRKLAHMHALISFYPGYKIITRQQ